MTDGAGPPSGPPGRPRWVVAVIVVAVVIVAAAVFALASGSGHGPGRHLPGGHGAPAGQTR